MADEPLAMHRIAAVETFKISSRYPRTVGKNAQRGIHGAGPTGQVRVVTTDRGAMGWGLSPAQELPGLVGRGVAELFDPATGVVAPEALALDFPLHDLAGAILGQSVYRMLGARGPRQVPCYDGAIYMDDILPEDAPRGISVVLENCRADYALGYRAFKLKIGRGHKWMPPEEGLQRDIEVTRRVRQAFPDAAILVDANDGYTLDGILRYLDAVADCGLFWVEEPFRENRADLLRLKEFLVRRSPATLIADGESAPDIPQLLALAREGLVDVLIMDIVGLGMTAWRRWLPEVAAAGARISPHTWGDALKTRYAAQFVAGVGHVLTVEGVPATTQDVDWSGYALVDGLLHLPDAPGFGMKLVRA